MEDTAVTVASESEWQ